MTDKVLNPGSHFIYTIQISYGATRLVYIAICVINYTTGLSDDQKKSVTSFNWVGLLTVKIGNAETAVNYIFV